MHWLQRQIRTRFVWLLLSAYFLGTFFPGFGKMLGGSEQLNLGYGPIVPQVILAIVVFLSAYSHYSKHNRIDVSKDTVRSLAHVFGIRLVVILLALPLLVTLSSFGAVIKQIVFGLSVVLVMPTAFSAIAWSGKSSGDSIVALFAVFATTIVSGLLLILGIQLLVVDHNEYLLSNLTGSESLGRLRSLYLFSVLPAMGIGVVFGRLATRFALPGIPTKDVNAWLILLLNYINASVAIPKITLEASFVPLQACVIGVFLFCLSGYVVANFLVTRSSISRQQQTSTIFASAMYNTGLAQVMIVMLFPQSHWALLPALLMTFLQHVGAAVYLRLVSTPILPAKGAIRAVVVDSTDSTVRI